MSKKNKNAPSPRDFSEFFKSRKRNMSKIALFLLLLFSEILYKPTIEIVAANGNTIIKSGPFLLLEKPLIKRLIITEPNMPQYLSCIATIEETFYYQDNTDYFYTWFRNDIELSFKKGARAGFIVNKNGTLHLPRNERASGVYRCKINANKTAVLSERITVIYPVLKRVRASSNIKTVSGVSLTLNCPIISSPPANVSWYYDDKMISEVKKYNSYVVLTNGSLVLRRVTQDDEGEYRCLAQNHFALKKTRQFTLTVTVVIAENDGNDGNRNSSKLIPILQDEVQHISKGENLTLLCYSLNESTNIEWWFQRTKYHDLIKISNQSRGFHNIYNAEIENDQGIYTCKTNSDSQSFNVIVTIPPHILNSLPSYETLISASLAFSCNTEGNPPPKISWYHNGAYLNSSYSRYINGNELMLHSFDPGEDGIYQCFAENVAGEVYSAAEVRYRNKADEIPKENPLKNIRCFPHSFNTINITFESDVTESLFIVHIVQEKPHRWTSPFAPMKLNFTSHVIISSQLPIYHPFELVTRVLFPTSEIQSNNKPQQQTILSSLRSAPVTCCTQGLLLHQIPLGRNRTFLTWSQPEIVEKLYYILQFSINSTQPHPKELIKSELRGTTQHVDLKTKDIESKLEAIEPFGEEMTLSILSRIKRKDPNYDNEDNFLLADIYSTVIPANVSGVVFENFQKIKIRVLILTTENENLAQDFRYVQWKTIDNGTTSEMGNAPFHLSTIESRMVGIYFQDIFLNEDCVEVCLWKIQFPLFNKKQPKCEQKRILNSYIVIRGLKPEENYRLNLFSCESHTFYGQLDVKTLPDPPGTISNQKIIRNNGLKLMWNPPLQPNGKVYHYNIMWTVGNSTHEANVPNCSPCSYKFPNLLESSKVNVSVRVVGETGVGAPIYIDLRNINYKSLEVERSSSAHTIYSGILIGILLSALCILCFITFFVLQKWRLKSSIDQLNTQSEMNFGNLSSIGGPQQTPIQHENTFQQECFEMQTLIPRSKKTELLTNTSNLLQKRPSQWRLRNIPINTQNSEQTQNSRQDRNYYSDINWKVETTSCSGDDSHNVMQEHNNHMNMILPSDPSLSYVCDDSLDNTASGNKKVMQVADDDKGKTTTEDIGQSVQTICLQQNKANDIVFFMAGEEEESVPRTSDSVETTTVDLKSKVIPEEENNDSLKNFDGANGISREKRNQCNNNNVRSLHKSTHKQGVNSSRARKKSCNVKFPKEKKLDSKREKSFLSLISPDLATVPTTTTTTDASLWTKRVNACCPSFGPNC